MRGAIRAWDYTWWIWLVSACLLLAGLLASPRYFVAAIGLTLLQTLYFVVQQRSITSFPAQLRIAYLILVVVSYYPPLRVLYWIPTIGTFALVFFGYCLLARTLSLFPWNRSEPLTRDRLFETFFSPPDLTATVDGALSAGCPGGVCSLEVQLGKRRVDTV